MRLDPRRLWRLVVRHAEDNQYHRRFHEEFWDIRALAEHNLKVFLENTLDDAVIEIVGRAFSINVYGLPDGFVVPDSNYSGVWDDIRLQTMDIVVDPRPYYGERFSIRLPTPTIREFHSPTSMRDYILRIVGYIRDHLASMGGGGLGGVERDYLRRQSAWVDISRYVSAFDIDIASISDYLHKENKKAKELLLSHCSESQVEEYNNRMSITVIGGETGTTYRLRKASQINVDVMDGDKRLYKLCTVADPEHNSGLPIEDQLLAQKTLIELNESEFLRIAKKW